MRKAIAAYLVVSSLFAATDLSANGSGVLSTAMMATFLAVTFAGGAGLFLGRKWGHWVAVTALSLQLLKIELDGFTYDVLSLVGIYLYAAGGIASGSISVGLSATFDPGFDVSIGTNAALWIGVNIFVAPLVGFLLAYREANE